jgi:hypothetical protein
MKTINNKKWEENDEKMKGKKSIVILVSDHIIHSLVIQMC